MMSPIDTVVGTVNATDHDWKFNNVQFKIIGGNPDPPLFDIGRRTVNATDHDWKFNNVQFKIIGGNPDPPLFDIGRRTGNTNEQFSMRGSTIFTQNAFTYYTPGVVDPNSFELLVRVTVDTAPELSATATVLVQVAYCTTTTTTTSTATTTRTTRIVTVMEYYWAPDPWFVAVMTVTGALLIAVLTLLIWKCFKRSSDLKGLSDMPGDPPPKPDDPLMKKPSMPSLNQQSTKFDGKAEDPVTGQQYLYSSSTGERRWM
ncbi:UNVERIFIED_CONTAM: hypothetical protein FKN15_076703 [Acipenser sinensis]